MRFIRIKQSFAIFAAFAVLGAAFKVMKFGEALQGLTEVRPVNAIPPIAGFVAGPLGALACGLGNLVSDLFDSAVSKKPVFFELTSLLGIAANFIAAYLPFRLWHLFSKEAPNLHRNKNIFLYIFICLINGFTTAWILSFGLQLFFGFWIEQIYTYVFLNNFAFALVLGMPVFIILTSDSVNIKCVKRSSYLLFDRINIKTPVCIAYSLIMAAVFVCVFFFHLNPRDAQWLHVLSALSLFGLYVQLI